MLSGFLEGLRGLVLSPGIPQTERRSVPRLRCYYPVSCRVGKDLIRPARVTEMSRQGMRMELNEPFKRGTGLLVTYASPHPSDTVRCKVAWARKRPSGNYSMGVAYDEATETLDISWVGYVLHELGFEDSDVFEKRSSIRFAAELKGELRTPQGELICPVTVLNLGVGGALVALPRSVAADRETLLSLPKLGVAHLELPAWLLRVRPNPDKKSGQLGHLRFQEMTKTQTRLLGKHLIALLRAAHR